MPEKKVDFAKQDGVGMHFEYTVPGTPQQNGFVEWTVATMFNKVHAMLNGCQQ